MAGNRKKGAKTSGIWLRRGDAAALSAVSGSPSPRRRGSTTTGACLPCCKAEPWARTRAVEGIL
eukprot:scaffold7387_cov231-Pinguiococcus_pyrenoidosus.AAC.4